MASFTYPATAGVGIDNVLRLPTQDVGITDTYNLILRTSLSPKAE